MAVIPVFRVARALIDTIGAFQPSPPIPHPTARTVAAHYFSLQLHTYFLLKLHAYFLLQLHTYFLLQLHTYF